MSKCHSYIGKTRHGENQTNEHQYSRDEKKDEMIEKLEHMMKEAGDESSRMAIQKCIEKLERE